MPTSNEVSIKITVDDQGSKALLATVRQLQQLQKEAAQTAASFTSIDKNIDSLVSSLSKANRETNRFATALDKSEREIRDVGRATKSTVGEMLDMNSALVQVGAGLSRLGDFGVRQLTAFISAGADLERLTSAYTSLLGSTEAANAAIAKLRVAAQDPGLTFNVAARGAQRFATLNIEVDESIRIIRGFANAAALAGTSGAQLDEGLRQVTQAISRGKLEQQDLTSILERFPSLTKIIRAEYGKTAEEVNTALEASGKTVRQFIGEITNLSGAARANTDTLANSFSNLQNAITQARQSIGTELVPVVKFLTNSITALVERFNELPSAAKAAAAAVVGVGTVGAKAGGGLIELIANIGLIKIAFGGLITSGLAALKFLVNFTIKSDILSDILDGPRGFNNLSNPGTGLAYPLITAIYRIGVVSGAAVATVVGLAVALRKLGLRGREPATNIEKLRKSIVGLDEAITTLNRPNKIPVLTGGFDALTASTIKTGRTTRDVTKDFRELTKAIRENDARLFQQRVAFPPQVPNVASRVAPESGLQRRSIIDSTKGLYDRLNAIEKGASDARRKLTEEDIAANQRRVQGIIAANERELGFIKQLARAEEERRQAQEQDRQNAIREHQQYVQELIRREQREIGFVQTLRKAEEQQRQDDITANQERVQRLIAAQERELGFIKQLQIADKELRDDAIRTNQERVRIIQAREQRELDFVRQLQKAEEEANQSLVDSDRARIQALRQQRESAFAEVARQIRETQGFYNQANRVLEDVSIGLDNVTRAFTGAANAGIIGARTLANVFASATMAIEGTAEAIRGVEQASVGLASGDPLNTITGILGAIGGTVNVITSFINLFKSFQRESQFEQAGIAGQTRADRPIGFSRVLTRSTARRSSDAVNNAARVRATENIGLAPPITIVNYIEVDGKTTQEQIKQINRLQATGRTTRRQAPRRGPDR